MPFVVTIATKAPKGQFDSSVAVSRVAVATLEEARRVVFELRIVQEGPRAHWRDYEARIGESGGTVGPLPDGTVIEVERTDWVRLAYDAGMRGRVLASSQQLGEADKVLQPFPPHAEILDVFNARQSA